MLLGQQSERDWHRPPSIQPLETSASNTGSHHNNGHTAPECWDREMVSRHQRRKYVKNLNYIFWKSMVAFYILTFFRVLHLNQCDGMSQTLIRLDDQTCRDFEEITDKTDWCSCTLCVNPLLYWIGPGDGMIARDNGSNLSTFHQHLHFTGKKYWIETALWLICKDNYARRNE